MRVLDAAILIAMACALGGCGYKPLDAPCSMDEGGGPLASPGREETAAASGGAPVQTLYFAEPWKAIAVGPFAAMPKSGDCGPLRPINAGALR